MCNQSRCGGGLTRKDPVAKYHEVAVAAGTDIFSISDTLDITENEALQGLKESKLQLIVRAKIGLPPDHLNYPDVLVMGKSMTNVTFNLMCSEFQVGELYFNYDENDLSWKVHDQADGGEAWVFRTEVGMSLEIVSARDDAAIEKLDDETKARMRAFNEDVFSVHKLLLDLSTFAGVSAPTIIGPESGLQGKLRDQFEKSYFSSLKKSKVVQPLLGCTMVANSPSIASEPSIAVTSFNYAIMPWMDASGKPAAEPGSIEAKIGTLNYLCVTDDKPRPRGPEWFGWNWIQTLADAQDHHGVVAVRRGKMAEFLRDKIVPLVKQNCYQPVVSVELKNVTGMGGSNYGADMRGGQEGRRLLKIQWAAEHSRQSGSSGHNGQIRVKTYYNLELDVDGVDIIVRQEQYVNLFLKGFLTSNEGNIRSRKRTDYYSILVDDGQIKAVHDQRRSTRSVGHENLEKKDKFQDFWTDINNTTALITRQLNEDISPELGHLPVAVVQDFVFPGGKTFTFTKANFSQYGDLLAFINYVEPPELNWRET